MAILDASAGLPAPAAVSVSVRIDVPEVTGDGADACNGRGLVWSDAGSPMYPHPHTVLVVDDDLDLREAVVQYLRTTGFDAVAAGGGHEGLGLLRQGLPACMILLDIRMPDMDGWHFREEQLLDPHIADIPVVMFSAESTLDGRARQLGIRDQLVKPVDPEEVCQLIERHCRRGD